MFSHRFTTSTIKTQGANIHLVHGGQGYPLLLLHGYPQTHCIWHQVADELAANYHVICPDLRGYGDSSKPASDPEHYAYSKRAMAQDMIDIMAHLGYRQFAIAGHDRGARVTHRLALDHPEAVTHACVMDIAPTHHMFSHTDQTFATGYYHWFFLIQPNGLPETMIGADPAYYLREKLNRWSGPDAVFSEQAIDEYIRCFQAEAIHASCEDYRAAASIDLVHDEADMDKRIQCPLLVLWGSQGFVHKTYNVLDTWRARAAHVEGKALDCGHFLPEEQPTEVIEALSSFLQQS